MTTRTRIRYTGRVQGVGFRYTARTIANQYPVTGWVRNEPDGSVTLEVQGAAEDVNAYSEALAQKMRTFIENVEETPLPPDGHEEHFEIRR